MHAFCNSARNFPDVRTLPTFPILSRRSHVAVSADFNQEDRKEIEYEKSLQYFFLEETGTHIHPRAPPNHSSTLHSSIFLSHPLLQGENIHGMRSITTFYITFNVISTALPLASTSSHCTHSRRRREKGVEVGSSVSIPFSFIRDGRCKNFIPPFPQLPPKREGSDGSLSRCRGRLRRQSSSAGA